MTIIDQYVERRHNVLRALKEELNRFLTVPGPLLFTCVGGAWLQADAP